MLSAFDEFPLVKQAFKKGAADYVLKQEIVPARMLELVREARRHCVPAAMRRTRPRRGAAA